MPHFSSTLSVVASSPMYLYCTISTLDGSSSPVHQWLFFFGSFGPRSDFRCVCVYVCVARSFCVRFVFWQDGSTVKYTTLRLALIISMEGMKEMRDGRRRGEARRGDRDSEGKTRCGYVWQSVTYGLDESDEIAGKNKTRTSGENNIIKRGYNNNRACGKAVGRSVTNEVLGYFIEPTQRTWERMV